MDQEEVRVLEGVGEEEEVEGEEPEEGLLRIIEAKKITLLCKYQVIFLLIQILIGIKTNQE